MPDEGPWTKYQSQDGPWNKYKAADLGNQPSMRQATLADSYQGTIGPTDPRQKFLLALPGPVRDAMENMGKVAAVADKLGANPWGVNTELPEAAIGLTTKEPTPLTTRVGNVDVPLTAAEISQNPSFSALESWLSKAPLASDLMQRFQKIRMAAINEYRQSILNGLGPKASLEGMGSEVKEKLGAFSESRGLGLESEMARQRQSILKGQGTTPMEAGESAQSKFEAIQEAARKQKSAAYRAVSEDLPPGLQNIDPSELRAKAKEILARKGGTPSTLPSGLKSHLEQIVATGRNTAQEQIPTGILGPSGESLMAPVEAKPKTLTWEKLHDLQSDYGSSAESIRKSNNGAGNVESIIYDDLKKAARSDMERRAKEIGGETWQKYEFAKGLNREYKTTFANDDAVKKFIKARPDQVFDKFVRGGSIEDLRKIKKIVGEPAMAPMKRLMLEDIVGGGDRIPSSVEIVRKLDDYKYKMSELLSPAEQAQLKKFAQTGELPKFVQTELEKQMASLAKRTPMAVSDAVMRGDPTIARAVKQIVGPQSWQPFRREMMERLIGEAGQDLFTSKKMENTLRNMEPEYRDLFFSPSDIKDISKIIEAKKKFETAESMWSNPSGTAKNLISWGTMAGAGSAATAGMLLHNPALGAAGAATIALTPPVLAKFYLSPTGRRLLVDGLTANEKNSALVFSRISAYALQAKREIRDEEARKYGLPVVYSR